MSPLKGHGQGETKSIDTNQADISSVGSDSGVSSHTLLGKATREFGLAHVAVQSTFSPHFSGPEISQLSTHQERESESHYESHLPRYHLKQDITVATDSSQAQAATSSSHLFYLQNYTNTAEMSLAYENRAFSSYPESAMMQDPSEHEESNLQHQRYPSPPPLSDQIPYNRQIDAALEMQMPELPLKEESEIHSPGRTKAIIKPDREVTKDAHGRFVCKWTGCNEEVKSFNRKCEWSKHMDKHDRPYKCPAEGCEKLPGFTYSGGLLRHQREVHNLHGGPRKQLNCPHVNCKRHTGKGFSRQENLNEHLRRVHTQMEGGDIPNGICEETEEEGSERVGTKRKRTGRSDDGGELREAFERMSRENQELRHQVEVQAAQIADLVQQTQALSQNMIASRMHAPASQAMM